MTATASPPALTPAERAELDALLAAYTPYGAAAQLFQTTAREVLLDGPAGTGKSRSVLEYIHQMLKRFPRVRALIARKTRASMTESVLVTYENEVLPPDSPIAAGGASRAMRQAYHYPNGSSLVVGGFDKAGKVMSTQYDLIGIFESTELTEDDWEKATTRLRNKKIPLREPGTFLHQIIGDCNPAGPAHWLNQRCLAGKTLRLVSRHEDNPTVTEEYLETLRALTGARRLRLYEGKWAAQEGLVYEEYNDVVHQIDKMPAGWERWRKYRSVDFGFTNPYVCLWFAEDPDGRLYMYREIYKTRTLVEDHARTMKDLSAGETYEATVADHDAEDRATLARHGIPTVGARKDISPGIQAVQARLKPAGDGRPRLFFLRDSLVEVDGELKEKRKPYSTTQEFGEYVWPKGKDGKPEKEEPVKDSDHGMDALRYMVAHLDLKFRKHERPPPPTGVTFNYLNGSRRR